MAKKKNAKGKNANNDSDEDVPSLLKPTSDDQDDDEQQIPSINKQRGNKKKKDNQKSEAKGIYSYQ